jgi:hypothetical protein
MILNRFHWLDDILLPVGVVTMRATWLFALLRTLLALTGGAGAVDPLPLLTLVWLPLAATVCARIAIRESLEMGRARRLVGVGGLVCVALAVWLQHYTTYPLWNPAWLGALAHDVIIRDRGASNSVTYALILGALLWWRGIVAGQQRTTYGAVYNSFGIGIGAWAVGLLIAQSAAPRLFDALGSLVLLFFFVSLSALALTGLESARRAGQSETGISVGFNRYWLLTVLLVIGGVLGFGLLVSVLIAPDTLRAFLSLFDPLFALAGQIAYLLLYVVVFLVFLIIQPLIDFLQRLPRNSQPNPVQPQNQSFGDLLKQTQDQTQGLPADLQLAIKLGIVILLALCVAFLFGRALRRYRFADEEDVDESREFIGSWAMLRAQLRQWWQALLARFFSRKRVLAGDAFLPLAAGEEGSAGQLSIREVYQQLLLAMRGRGQPRPPSATPHEYLATLRQSLPTAGEELSGVTDAYGEARYGPTPVPTERVSRVNAWWAQIKQALSGGT